VGERKLHIGGTTARAGWEILNANSAPYVDHVGKAEDLSRFADHTFSHIYASHVLEHLGYQSALPDALTEWHRVLRPAGQLMVSVPDLDTLCELFTQREGMGIQDRFELMRMMFGGQTDSYDFHCVGLNEEFLSSFLVSAGFISIERVHGFGLFQDYSELVVHGRAISLNIQASKPSAQPPQHTLPVCDNSVETAARKAAPRATKSLTQVATSSAWGAGYFTGVTYGSYAFQELAPGWIDYALLSQKQRPPRERDGAAFSYVEMGSGMGLGLCLLAAAYPEGQFIGIDFHPSHIAHSQWLVRELGLNNVRFHEADFVELADPSARSPFDRDLQADYVIAHGIISWISPVVQTALYHLVSSILKPGGAFYCSYNTFPGWLDRTAFKALTDGERQRLGAGNLLAAIDQATSKISSLLQASKTMAQALPNLSQNMQSVTSDERHNYIYGEFGHDYWQPYYVSEVHQQLAAHKLSYAASASLPNNHPSLLPAPLSTLVAEESDGTLRELLLDLAINQSFRRDVFVKGPLHLSTAAQQQQLSQLRLRVTPVPPADPAAAASIRIETTLGTITDDSGRIQQIENRLSPHPASLAEIHEALDLSPDDLVIYTSLLLHAGRVGIDRGEPGDAAIALCRGVNRRMMELMQGGHNLGFLAAPRIGHGAQPFSLMEVFALEALQQGLDESILSSCVLMGLQATGAELRGPDGLPFTDSDQALQQIQRDINRFREQTLPRLEQLGIV
jgi:predicted SAM-dependent methyltransferase/trans-aconitate methyltransferase